MTSLWNLPVFRLVATDRCRAAAPWFAWTRARDPLSELRRRANALERGRLGATRPIEQRLAALLHAALALPRAACALHRWGPALHAADGVPYLRQWLDLQTCAWRHGLRPQVYYYLALHRRPRAQWSQYLDPAELHHLQRDLSPADVGALEDKLRFHGRAVREGIATAPLLAVWCDGRLRPGDTGEPWPPRRDFFVKRAATYCSVGVMGFRHDRIAGGHFDDRRRYDADALSGRLAAASRGLVLLVQPWLDNHHDLAGFSAGALCNYRIVTARRPDGRIELLLAALRFPIAHGLTCAERGITLCAAVGLATGRLHAAGTKHPRLGRLVRHPLTGRRIEGFPVPRWPEILALAARAHEAWPEFPVVGWDIADTRDGLMVLEGSCLWGGYLAQMSGSPPLGLTRFPEIYLAHLRGRTAAPPCPVPADT